jgi:hypothetical protein
VLASAARFYRAVLLIKSFSVPQLELIEAAVAGAAGGGGGGGGGRVLSSGLK